MKRYEGKQERKVWQRCLCVSKEEVGGGEREGKGRGGEGEDNKLSPSI